MANRRNPQVDERRLRPIYDMLDNHNHKKAIQELDRILKKNKYLTCAKALKAIALIRVGRTIQAKELLDTIISTEHPTLANTLQAMTIAFKDLCMYNDIVKMYEKASQNMPNEIDEKEDILAALFMSYVRTSDVNLQQKTAAKLSRICPGKAPYYFWNIMSLYLQFTQGDETIDKNVHLNLALKYCEKYLQTNKLDSNTEMDMYLMILDKMDAPKKILETLDGPNSDHITEVLNRKSLLKAECFKSLGCYLRVDTVYRVLLRENPDAWNFYLKYIENLFKLIETGNFTHKEDEFKSLHNPPTAESKMYTVAGHVFELARTFLVYQAEANLRGAFLAKIELCVQLKDKPHIPMPNFCCNLDMMLKEYVEMFANRSSCFTDIKLYLKRLQDPQAFSESIFEDNQEIFAMENFTSVSHDKYFLDSRRSKAKMEPLQRYITYICIEQCTGYIRRKNTREMKSYLLHMYDVYQASFVFDKELLKTDLKTGDTLLLLVAHGLMDMYFKDENITYLWTAIQFMYIGIDRSSANFQLKFMLMRLYSMIGCYELSSNLQDNLPFKHIQWDTLSYLIVNDAIKSAHISDICKMHRKMTDYFLGTSREITESTISAYKQGNFTQVIDFNLLARNTKNSLSFESLVIQTRILKIIRYCDSKSELDEIGMELQCKDEVSSTPFDPRQFDLFTSYSYEDVENYAEVKRISYNEEVLFNHHQNALIRCITQACKGDMPNLKEALNDFKKFSLTTIEHSTRPFVWSPTKTRLHSFQRMNIFPALEALFQIVIYMNTLVTSKLENTDETMHTTMNEFHKYFEGFFDNMDAKTTYRIATDGIAISTLIENLYTTVEAFSYCTLLVALIHSICRTIKADSARDIKRKKIKEMPAALVALNVMTSNMKEMGMSLLGKVDTSLHDVEDMPESYVDILKDPSVLWKFIQRRVHTPKAEMIRILIKKNSYLDEL